MEAEEDAAAVECAEVAAAECEPAAVVRGHPRPEHLRCPDRLRAQRRDHLQVRRRPGHPVARVLADQRALQWATFRRLARVPAALVLGAVGQATLPIGPAAEPDQAPARGRAAARDLAKDLPVVAARDLARAVRAEVDPLPATLETF